MLSFTFTNGPTKGWLGPELRAHVEKKKKCRAKGESGVNFIKVLSKNFFKRKHNRASRCMWQGSGGVFDLVNGPGRDGENLKASMPCSRTICLSPSVIFNCKTKIMILILWNFCEE